MTKKSNKHIVLIGLNFWPCRHSGDKNFWIDMVSLLARRLNRITILSVRKNPVSTEEYSINSCKISIKYIPPKFLEIGDVEGQRRFWREGVFPRKLGVIEKLLNSKRICLEIKKIYTEVQYDQIHLMDNLGLVNRLIAGTASSPVSVSAMAYQGSSKLLYDSYLYLSYKHPNLTVVPYSTAYAEKLRQIGIKKDKIVHIRWGVKLSPERPTAEDSQRAKELLALPYDKPLFLWAGYIQQIQREDFLYAIKAAKQALKKGLNSSFYFAFKPESFDKGFEKLHEPQEGIFVQPTTIEQFDNLKKAADIFYSPVLNKKCRVAPPLTWIELVAGGTPLLTTDVPGAGELVSNGNTGFLAQSTEDLIEQMFEIRETFSSMRSACIRKVKSNYNICDIAEKYLKLWLPLE